jgi:hypothetical protein
LVIERTELLAGAGDPQRPAIACRGRRVALAVSEPWPQRGSGGTVEWDDTAAVALTLTDDELAGALGQAHVVADVEVGELAGAQQQLHGRPVAARCCAR